jgi:hypothetical protein
MKKNIIRWGLLIIVGLGILFYNLSKPKLTFYPKQNNEVVELYLLKERFNFDILADMQEDLSPFINITVTDGKNSSSALIGVDKLDLVQSKCEKRWDCPVFKMSLEQFQKKFNNRNKLKNKSFDSILDNVFESDITKSVK